MKRKGGNEVEIKFRIESAAEVRRRLRAKGFRRITAPTREINTLYDLPGHPLRARGQLLRLRQYGKQWVLTHKAPGRGGRHKSRVETETRVANGAEMDGILRALGFAPVFRYEKFREEWSDGQGHVVVDKTPVGVFGEIEGGPRWIDGSAKKLGIARGEYLTDTYAGLFAKWKRETGSPAQEMTFAAVEGRRK